MTVAIDDVDIYVVCRDVGMEHLLIKIKQYLLKNQLMKSWKVDFSINKMFDLESAVKKARSNYDKSILIPVGYEFNDVKRYLDTNDNKKLEIIVRPPRPRSRDEELNETPHASLFSQSRLINVQDTMPALRKSILKKHFTNKVQIRNLRTKQDFRQYFKLRYTVWKELGYLPEKNDCILSQWELNFTDRTALPIGAFSENGKLVASARLVFPSGLDSHHVPLIKELIAEAGDEKLKKSFEYPQYMSHPFEILEVFSGFNCYFANLIRNKIKSAEVSRVIVSPDYRSTGLGEVLVDSLMTVAQHQERVQTVFLACKKEHEFFYNRCGFESINGVESESFSSIRQPSIAMVRGFN